MIRLLSVYVGLSIGLFTSNDAISQTKNFALTFGVHQNGDTIKNLIDAYVDIHAHPQQLFFKLADGSKKSFRAEEIKFLRIYEKPNSFKDWILTDYLSRQLPVKKGGYCYHFVQTNFVYDQFSISRSPYCNQCTNLTLYLVKSNDDKAIEITKKNFKELVETYFKGCKRLEEFSKNKRYTPYRLSRYLEKTGTENK